ncbi:hypothetical protein LTR37_006025 [Vermiconidia calcicola]|uniref:Uncharacterized protein n=1 Tax=Vermiconidia calcicola TaxID=1690605 RepID=A0ACC3NH70_9PEZI|nr:hypothetical protein LTR37_006025 [Vermiconidia calcicola]
MRFSLKPGRNKSTHHINFFPETQHPDRRSIAVEPGFDPSVAYSPDDIGSSSPQLAGGLTRSQTVLRREGARNGENGEPQPSPTPLWSSEVVAQSPTASEQPEESRQTGEDIYQGPMPMSQQPYTPGKTSSDSGRSAAALDRWSQRRLQRLNTEQGFREQRQGGQGILSPSTSMSDQSGYNSTGVPYASQQEPQPQQYQQAQPQPQHPSQQPTYQSSRTVQASHQPNAGLGLGAHSHPVSSSSRLPNYSSQETSHAAAQQQHHQQYSPPDTGAQYSSQENLRPQLAQARSYSQPQPDSDKLSMSSNNGSLPAPKALRTGNSNRQSMHNGLNSREGGSGLGAGQNGGQGSGVAAFNANIVPSAGQGQASQGNPQHKAGDIGRITPQPVQSGEDMSEDDINQLIKDHKELREKYTKVKKYYFEKEDQVKQLQNSLAHQRLSQSRTSLDDSEYTTRFNRLDGLIAQLAFSIRKSWRSLPPWLASSVNKDGVQVGKQEMTAAGRAFISCWLVSEVFDRYFHPDLEQSLSAQLKGISRNIRRFAPPAQTAEEEEYLTAKVVNWRLSTLEGLQDSLRSPSCAANRSHLTERLKEDLISALAVHLQEPPPSDLEGGVHMIIELVVSIAIHLPLESRDVQIDYFMPGYSILHEQMKLESGIPPLNMSIADDAAERSSNKSAHSDITDNTEHSTAHGDQASSKKRSMLSAITGSSKPKDRSTDQQRRAGAGGSSSSLNRPESSQGIKDQLPRVRMAAGIGVQIRGRSVLVKAPVFATS